MLEVTVVETWWLKNVRGLVQMNYCITDINNMQILDYNLQLWKIKQELKKKIINDPRTFKRIP